MTPSNRPDDRDAPVSGAPVPAFGPVPLTPISFLERSEVVHAGRAAVIDGELRLDFGELADRCRHLAGALVEAGIEPGDRVSVLAPNTHVALEAHFGVPGAGAVLNALNTRLSVGELTYIVGHAGSRLLLCDHEHLEAGREIADQVDQEVTLVDCGRPDSSYEQRLAEAAPVWRTPTDEWGLLSLNYTSGTTGRPKGVMYAHRGAHLQALAMIAQAGLDASAVFLWTLPMFHCNGWCYPWAVTGVGGTHVALRHVTPENIWAAIHDLGVTHFNAAPTVLTMLVNHPDAAPAPHTVRVATGGAPPSPTLLARLAELDIEVTHLYGLTETYGPSVICEWLPEWDRFDAGRRAELKARQGVANLIGTPVRVVDAHGADVAADGTTPGEVVLRGDNVMLGYYKDPEATAAASVAGPGGAWFRTGDIGVMHPDHYLELRDRAKDVIISGGENIASIEVEQVIDAHPDVLEAAVVAAPDELWGEIPVAFVTLREGATLTADEVIDHVRSRIAHYKAPKRVEFGPLPKTSTGKIQKFRLRERVGSEAAQPAGSGEDPRR